MDILWCTCQQTVGEGVLVPVIDRGEAPHQLFEAQDLLVSVGLVVDVPPPPDSGDVDTVVPPGLTNTSEGLTIAPVGCDSTAGSGVGSAAAAILPRCNSPILLPEGNPHTEGPFQSLKRPS